jgi:hypothetical protein
MQMKMSVIIEKMPKQLRDEIISNKPIEDLVMKGIPLSQIMLLENTLRELFNSMKAWDRLTLKLILGKFATKQFSLSSLLDVMNSSEYSGAEIKVGLISLQRKGIIFAIKKHWGEISYCLPADTFEIWQNIMMGTDLLWEEIVDKHVSASLAAPNYLVINLFCFLNYLEHHEVVLTKKGELPKRHIHKIMEKLQWNEGSINMGWIQNVITSSYPLRMALTLDFAERLGLIQRSLTNISLCRTNLNDWLQLSRGEMNERNYSIFRDVFEPRSAGDEQFLAKIHALSSQKWYLIEDFISWLQEYDIIIMFSDWMDLLAAFGWIEQGFDNQARAIFCLKLNQESSNERLVSTDKFYVQSDYEILVPPDVSFAVRWELTFISDHIQTDQVGIYRLTEQSLQRALISERSIEQCIHFLQSHSFYGVPDSVLFVLKHWAHSAIPITLLPQKNSSIVREGMESTNVPDIQSTCPFELAAGLPSRNDVYPSWQMISPLWWKECRVYHTSTRKEIVQLAIEWKAILKLSNDYNEWTMIPKQVQEHDLGWNLLGWVQSDFVSYSQDQWQAIQLILPGFDEL